MVLGSFLVWGNGSSSNFLKANALYEHKKCRSISLTLKICFVLFWGYFLSCNCINVNNFDDCSTQQQKSLFDQNTIQFPQPYFLHFLDFFHLSIINSPMNPTQNVHTYVKNIEFPQKPRSNI